MPERHIFGELLPESKEASENGGKNCICLKPNYNTILLSYMDVFLIKTSTKSLSSRGITCLATITASAIAIQLTTKIASTSDILNVLIKIPEVEFEKLRVSDLINFFVYSDRSLIKLY